MELLLGSHVREHGNRVGRLAGFELEPSTRCLRCIFISADGDLGEHAAARPVAAISHVHDNGEIELRTDIDVDAQPHALDVVPLSRSTRFKRAGHDQGRLAGIELDAADRRMTQVFARPHWWSKRTTFDAGALDYTTRGEIRGGVPHGTRAA